MPAGRPSSFTQEMADKICDRLATSELGLEDVLEEIRISDGRAPSIMAVWRWENANEAFREQSARARKMQAQLLHDRAQRYAREPLIGRVTRIESGPDGEKTVETVSDNVERSKLLVQTTLKRAGQLDTKKYGERLGLEHSGELNVQLAERIASARKRNDG